MQFRAARSRWMKFRELRYSMPQAMSTMNRTRVCRGRFWWADRASSGWICPPSQGTMNGVPWPESLKTVLGITERRGSGGASQGKEALADLRECPRVKILPVWSPQNGPLSHLKFLAGLCEGEGSLLTQKGSNPACLFPNSLIGPAHQSKLSPRVFVPFELLAIPPQALTKGFSPIREASRKACRSPCFMKGKMTMGMGRRPLALLRRLTPGDKGIRSRARNSQEKA